jgi:hypothetical protein
MHIPPFETAVGLQFSYKVYFYLNSYELFMIFLKGATQRRQILPVQVAR